jgi:type IV secretory pathway TrbD component
LLLHAVYFERTVVIEYFIYSAHFSFAVTALVLGRWVGAREGLGTWLMGLFLAVLALNNLDVINRIIAHYR